MSGRIHQGRTLQALRAQARGGVLCALVAMLLQLFSVASHVHLNDRATVAGLAKSAIAGKALLASAPAAHLAADPAKPAPRGDSDGQCQQCLAGHLVTTAAIFLMPAWALPVAYGRSDPPDLAISHTPFNVAAAFWSRGPPLS